MRRAIFLVALLLVPAGVSIEQLTASETVEVTALAVSENGVGFIGIASTLQVQVIADGAGQVFVDTKPLSETDMQASARLAARVAADTLGLDWLDYDYLIVMRSGSTIIGGPSAGAAMALAIATALHNLESTEPWTLDRRVAATGTINPDGTVGPVGGIPAKAEGARDAGITRFLYPAGQEVASTRTVVNGSVQNVLVSMDSHCDELNIRCEPAATLGDLLAAAAGVSVIMPEIEVPDTSGYEQYLGPSVRAQVAGLAARIQAVGEPTGTEAQVDAVEARLAQAQDWSSQAQASLDAERFYQAATFSFRGNIQARAAQMMQDAFSAETLEPIREELDRCHQDADEAVHRVDGAVPRDLTGWSALGAAQVRASDAQGLADRATSDLAGADSVTELAFATETIGFCLERAGSVHWWADLADAFPAGGELGDARALVLDLMDRAREAIAYGQAVGAVDDSADLEAAEAMLALGWLPGAAIEAVEAEVGASLALQTVAGTVSELTLDAARDRAARAVIQARLTGAEPVVSVSLLELAESSEGADSLASYWQARTLALLAPVEPQQASFRDLPRTPDQDRAAMMFAFATGMIAASGIWVMVYIAMQIGPARRD